VSDADLWFHRPRPKPDAAARIFCLPFAGGRAQIFNGWPEGVPAEVEVVALQLPGRAARVQEDPFERLEPLLEALLEALEPELDRPYHLFGHSMGGLVAFEIARGSRRASLPEPGHLFIGGLPAPHLIRQEQTLSDLAESGLKLELERLEGTDSKILDNEEMMRVLLPSLKSDLRIYDEYEFEPGEPLACPVTALGGRSDPVVERPELEAWSEHTTADVYTRLLPGNHFFLQPAERAMLQIVARRLGGG
jgi:surfactin synthase thioesterase subunit